MSYDYASHWFRRRPLVTEERFEEENMVIWAKNLGGG